MKLTVTVCLTLVLAVCSFSMNVSPGHASSHEADIAAHKSCKYCGMDREKFAHSRMVIEFEDGSSVATCSLHCAAVDLANNIDKAPKSIKVADYNTKQLIDAEKACWVIGGGKQGVMTKNAKWAFIGKDKAEEFVKQNGGKLVGFDEAIKAAYEDMYTDTKMIRDKRKQMRMKKP
jgi:nitrous oxide reductase accessory protein NosL